MENEIQVSIVKLTSGEELITKVNRVQKDGGSMTQLVDPCVVVFAEKQDRNLSMTFYPTALASKDRSVFLSPDAIVWTSEPSTEALALYIKRFNKIAVPEEKKLVIPGQ